MAIMKSLVVCCLIVSCCVAEELPIQADSLKNELIAHLQEDSIRVNLLLTLAAATQYSLPDTAVRYAESALNLSQKVDWRSGVARSYGTLGNIYHLKTNYVAAVDYYQKALKIGSASNDKRFAATLLTNTAMIQAELQQFGKARSSYQEALAAFRELKHSRGIATIMMNIGVICYRQHDYAGALEYSDQSLKIAEDSGYVQIAAYALGTKGLTLVERAEREGSLQYSKAALGPLRKSLDYAEQTGDARLKAQSLGGIGQAFVVLRDWDKAERYLRQSIKVSGEIGNLQYEREGYEWLSKAFEYQGKSDKALTSYRHFIVLRDSILNDEKRQEIERAEMQADFETREAVLKAEHEKKEELAFEQLRQQRIQKNSVLGGVAIVLVAGVATFLLYRNRREAEFRMRVAETEMKALRSQMNPHFIFNSLNSISDFIAKHDIKSADYYLMKFAKLMRLILEHSEKKEVPLSDDLKALELYMQLEALRLSNKFVYEVCVDDSIDKETTLVPPLLLQPFVENSIWHGIAPKHGNGKINIRIERQNGTMNCIVEDNGVGRKRHETAPADEKKHSLGIKITKARIDILNQIKQANATVELVDLSEGTRVEVRLPVEVRS